MPVTIEAPWGETKYVKEATCEGETEVDKMIGKFIKRRKSYIISFQIGFFISYEEMKKDWYSLRPRLVPAQYLHFTIILQYA